MLTTITFSAYNCTPTCAQGARGHTSGISSDKAAPQRRTWCSLQTLFPMHPERESISAVDWGHQVCTQTDVKRAAREAL